MNKIIYLYISLSCRTNVSSFTKTRSCLRLWLAFSWYLKIKMEHLVKMIEKLENVGLNHNYITNKNSAIWFVISSSLLYWAIYVLCHTWLILYGTYYLLQFPSSVTDSHQKVKPNRTREQMNNEKTKKLQEQNLMSSVPWFKTVGFSTAGMTSTILETCWIHFWCHQAGVRPLLFQAQFSCHGERKWKFTRCRSWKVPS